MVHSRVSQTPRPSAAVCMPPNTPTLAQSNPRSFAFSNKNFPRCHHAVSFKVKPTSLSDNIIMLRQEEILPVVKLCVA